ncbi:hypothetical protein EG835_01175 [bacterium]|nr:hypothetical protein [bacterium]
MKRFVAVLLTIVLVTALAGCGSSGGESRPIIGGAKGSESAGGSSAIGTVEDLKAEVDADHSGAEWYADLKGMETATVLGAPVLILDVAWGMADTDFQAKNDKTFAMVEAIQAYESPLATNILIRDADGAIGPGGSTSGADALPMADAFDLPAAPAAVGEVKPWLDAVYGPGGLVKLGANEKWYSSITGIAMEDVGVGPQMTVATTLGAADKLELFALQTAVYTSGSPLLARWAIRGAGGHYSSIGGGVPQVGGNGFYYPAE